MSENSNREDMPELTDDGLRTLWALVENPDRLDEQERVLLALALSELGKRPEH